MKILICCATTAELKVVKEEIKKLDLKIRLPIEYLCTGIGNHETIFQLTKFLLEHAEEKYFIVNVGVCWRARSASSNKGFPCLKAIQVSVVEHLSIGKEAIIPIFLKFAPLGKVISSEVVVDTREMLKNSSFFTPCEGSRPTQQQVALEDGGATYIDMESRGIELVAQHFQLPRLLVKVPVDEVGEETKQFDRGVALEKLRNQVDYKGLIEKVVAYIHTLA